MQRKVWLRAVDMVAGNCLLPLPQYASNKQQLSNDSSGAHRPRQRRQ
jgi:hypothetical protein